MSQQFDHLKYFFQGFQNIYDILDAWALQSTSLLSYQRFDQLGTWFDTL
jgi:hypothetical protein